jgi:predicted nuclease of predicted toxin-antitoxin system
VIRLYADEQFPLPVVQRLRTIGYDVLTVQDAGQANRKISDDQVLTFAIARNRAVITENRRDFVKLHQQFPDHAGIIVCSKNLDWDRHAANIQMALGSRDSIAGALVRVKK